MFLGVLQMSSDILQPLMDSDITKEDTGIGIEADIVEIIEGDIDKNILNGTDKNDHIYGMDGDDEVKAQKGDDWLYGGNGNDKIWGNEGNDYLYGEQGKDRLFGGKGNDVIEGGLDDDHLGGQDGDDQVKGQDGHDWLYGGNGNDKLWGNEGDDHLYGGQGKDRLFGGKGNDVIDGGKGDDYIDLGSGGYDTLVLAPDNGYDKVLHFKPGEDKIKLVGLTFEDLKLTYDQQSGSTIIRINKPGHPNHDALLANLKKVNPKVLNKNHFISDQVDPGDPGDQGDQPLDLNFRTLDGSGNHPDNLGQVGDIYRRVAPANYVKNTTMVSGPEPRKVSNLIFNDLHINLFSERDVSHLGFGWGQFLDHTFGLAAGGDEEAPILYDTDSVFEEFKNRTDIDFTRSARDGKDQINTVSSLNNGFNVYGSTVNRLEWLREGPVNGDMSDNSAKLLLTEEGFLPRERDRAVAIEGGVDLMGRLRDPRNAGDAAVAGDRRVNENTALTALHTLFAREHNRVVDILCAADPTLGEETKFQIARKHVIALQQHITYNEFLPALGVKLDPYKGYDPTLDPRLSNEFATVGYRAHSMVHGDFDIPILLADPDDIQMLEDQGAKVDGDVIEVPAIVQFGNADVVEKLKLGPVLQSLFELNYNNDETIDNQLRSVLFQKVIEPDFADGPGLPNFVAGLNDIGAIDVQRGRDHGIPYYNDLRHAYNLKKADNFYEVTGESIHELEEILNRAGEMGFVDALDGKPLSATDLVTNIADFVHDDASMIDILLVLDKDRNPIIDGEGIRELFEDNMEVEGIFHIKRSTLAVRLEHLYEDVDRLDAFTGMVSERHQPGSEMGLLQQKMWKEEFENMRDADKFFYQGKLEAPQLQFIEQTYGINSQLTLREVIEHNTSLGVGDVQANVFFSPGEEEVDV